MGDACQQRTEGRMPGAQASPVRESEATPRGYPIYRKEMGRGRGHMNMAIEATLFISGNTMRT